jgi:CHAT domain-containing protein
LLHAEALLGQGKTKEAAGLLRIPVPPLPALSQMVFRRQVDLADALLVSDARQANSLLDQASAGALDPDLQLRIHQLRGKGWLLANNTEKAEDEFTAAMRQAVAQGNAYREAGSLNNLSLCQRRRGHYEEAVALATQAVEKAGRAHAGMVQAQAHNNLANYDLYLGDLGGSLEHLQQAIGIFEAIDARADLMIAWNLLGLVRGAQDDAAGASQSHERAYRLALDLGQKNEAARYAANLSLAFIKDRQWSNAATWNQIASQLVDPAGGNPIVPYIARNQARIAEGQGNVDEAVRACQTLLVDSPKNQDRSLRWEAYAILAGIDARSRRFAKANQEFASALAAIDAARTQLEIPQNRITKLSRLVPFYQQYVDSLVEQASDGKALTVIESSRALVLAESLRRKADPMVFDAAALMRLAETMNSSIVSFWLAPQRSFAWLITPREVRRFALPPSAEIESQIAAYRNSVEHSWGDPLAAKDAAGTRLWTVLLGEMAPRIPHGSRVIVVPDGMLHRLNLETLPVPGPNPHYWVEDVELAVAPSMTLLAANTKPWHAGAPSLLLMGAPVPVAGFDKLPQAEAEIAAIQNRFPDASKAVFTGAAASVAAYRQVGPERFSVIHFAAHAEPNPESPLESALVLSPEQGQYLLKARDIVGSQLTADLVTISACRSAGARVYAGEGLIGLAWAFLEAGSNAVIAGLWDVNDGSSRWLMDRLYAGIAAGQAPAAALHDAKMALLQGDPRFRKPYFWAPFQVYVRSARWSH